MYRHAVAAGLVVFFLFADIGAQNPQKAEVTIGLNEAFFDTLPRFDFSEFRSAAIFDRSE